MIPVVFGYALGAISVTAYGISVGASCGTGYAVGRKVGRVICEKLDSVENKIKHIVTNQ